QGADRFLEVAARGLAAELARESLGLAKTLPQLPPELPGFFAAQGEPRDASPRRDARRARRGSARRRCLSSTVVQPVAQRFQAAREVAHALEGRGPLVLVRGAGGARGLPQLPGEGREVGADLGLELAALLGGAALHHPLRIADLVPEPGIADRGSGFLQL